MSIFVSQLAPVFLRWCKPHILSSISQIKQQDWIKTHGGESPRISIREAPQSFIPFWDEGCLEE